MKYTDTIEATNMVARVCRLPGLMPMVWGTHSLAAEGLVHPALRDKVQTRIVQDRVAETCASLFDVAEPFYVSTPLCDLVQVSAQTLPVATTLSTRHFPVSAGALFFEKHLPLPPRQLIETGNAGLPLTEPAPLSGFGWQLHGGAVTLVSLHGWSDDTSSSDWFKGVYVGNVPLTVSPWEFATMNLATCIETHKRRIGANLEAASDPHGPGNWVNAERYDISMHYIVATLMLLNQTVLTARTRTPVDRATRRRAERAQWKYTSNVEVVTLRRAEVSSPTGESKQGHVNWSCRWMVRPHWRTLHRGTPDERTICIPTYLKGPPGLALKSPSPRVWAVVR